MLERLAGSDGNSKILGTLSAVLFNFGLISTDVKAFEPKDLNPKSNLYVATQQLQKDSMGGRDNYESLILTIKYKGQWYSVGVKGSPTGISNLKLAEAENKLMELVPDLDFYSSDLIAGVHNHSAEVMMNSLSSFGLKRTDIKNKNLLLSGPSNGYGDCPKPSTGLVSVIVEPGGKWLCKSEDDSLNTYENGPKLTALRRELILASQNLPGSELRKVIDSFIKEAREQVGLKIEFIPNETKEVDFLKRVQNFAK